MLQLIRKIVKQIYLSIPQKLFAILGIVIVILLPSVIFWLSLYNLAYGEWFVGFILLLMTIFAVVEAIAILISIDDLLDEIEKKKKGGKK